MKRQDQCAEIGRNRISALGQRPNNFLGGAKSSLWPGGHGNQQSVGGDLQGLARPQKSTASNLMLAGSWSRRAARGVGGWGCRSAEPVARRAL